MAQFHGMESVLSVQIPLVAALFESMLLPRVVVCLGYCFFAQK